jgi:hypothetical protein
MAQEERSRSIQLRCGRRSCCRIPLSSCYLSVWYCLRHCSGYKEKKEKKDWAQKPPTCRLHGLKFLLDLDFRCCASVIQFTAPIVGALQILTGAIPNMEHDFNAN